jgi:hypothetical protein
MSDVTREERIRAATAGAPVGGYRVSLPEPDRTYITIRQAMDLTGAARRTVMGWLARGAIQRFKAENGYTVLIDKLELESFDFARRGGNPRVIDGEPVEG